jgi:sigma-B regulation protein RsbU (phosphoserine phosphatase)
MANFQASLSILARIHSDLVLLATELNRIIFENTGGERFITAFFCTVDLEKGVIDYLNAGHPAVVGIIDGAGPITLDSNCTILGALPELPVRGASAIGFENFAQFMGVTDGIEEMTNDKGVFFGIGPLKQVFSRDDVPALDVIFNGFLADIDAYKGSEQLADDMTVLAFSARRQS